MRYTSSIDSQIRHFYCIVHLETLSLDIIIPLQIMISIGVFANVSMAGPCSSVIFGGNNESNDEKLLSTYSRAISRKNAKAYASGKQELMVSIFRQVKAPDSLVGCIVGKLASHAISYNVMWMWCIHYSWNKDYINKYYNWVISPFKRPFKGRNDSILMAQF